MPASKQERLFLIGVLLQLVALVPLFSMAYDTGRLVEKVSQHEKWIDRHDNRSTASTH